VDSWTSWLWALAAPLVKRVLVALGMGYASFEGAATVIESSFDAIQASFGGLLAEVAALLAMAGFFDAMAIMSGGIMGGLAWMAMKRWALSPAAPA